MSASGAGTPGFVVRMVKRETRAAVRRLGLLTASIAIGVAALVAINSFTDNLRDSVHRQSQALLGADVSFSSRRPFSPGVEALLDSLGTDSTLARQTSFAAMAYVPRTEGTRLVQVTALDGPFPFYGRIRTEPAPAWDALQRGPNVVVDPSLLTALRARVGDTLALGEGRFVITGTVHDLPGDVGVRSAFGPRIFIPASRLDSTGLLGFGARAQYQAFLKVSDAREAQAIADRYRTTLRPERVRVRTVSDDEQDLNESLSRLASYLGLVALVALLLGGLGVASAVSVFVKQKMESIAVLRCLGATAGQVFAVYLAESAIMGLMGSAVGAALGVGVQQVLPGVLREFLPVDVTPTVSWPAVAIGVGTGLWVALVFALLPLLSVRLVSPLEALRRPFDEAPRRPRDPWRWPAALALGASVVALAAYQVGSWRQGAIFAGAVGAAVLVLWLAAGALIRAVRRWFPTRWPYVWRQGLANLYRPANQTTAVVLAIGFGAFLLGTLLLVQYNLLRQLRLTGGTERPNLVMFDIQPDQVAGVEEELRQAGLPVAGPVPIVPMRIQSVRGRPVERMLADTARRGEDGEPSGAWAFRREYRSTYRDTLVASERLVAGKWWDEADAKDATVAISVEQGVAGELGVGVGDEIVWDVQGVPIRTRVTSLREVDWARFEPNFFVVFEPGTLEDAPQTFVLLTRVTDPAARGTLQRRLVERFANVTSLDLTIVQEALETLLDRVVLAIRFMAFFSLATGALVLVGAVSTSRFQRMREAVLLKTLGATRRQVVRVLVAEYLSLGLLAAVTAAALATVAAWALARFLFEGPFGVPVLPFAGLAAAVVLVTVLVGLAGSREVWRRTPLEVLRTE